MSDKIYLTERQLSERWALQVQTLRNWRLDKKGPTYYKIGGRVLYAKEDIEAFENESRKETTGNAA